MLVDTVSSKISCLLLICLNSYLVSGDKGGANIVVQGKSDGHGGGGSVVVNAPKKGPQNIVVRDYRGTVVLNSHKKGGANIVINSHEEKKPHHSHHHHHEPHHHHGHHGHHELASPKMMPMLGESGSASGSKSPIYGSRTVKPYESEEVDEEQVEPTPTASRKRKGSKKIKKKAQIMQEQSDVEEVPRVRGRSKGDSDSESESQSDDESQSEDAYSPSMAEEDPYPRYSDQGSGPVPQSDRKKLNKIEKGAEFGVDQQIDQGLLAQLAEADLSDPSSASSSAGSSLSSLLGGSGSAETFGLSSSDLASSPDHSSESFNSDALKGLSLSDALFGSDKDTSSSSNSGLLDVPWSKR